MEQHGNNHPKKVFAIIPARYASTRLAGKLLLEIAGKPLILHTLDRARETANIDEILVATDDERIFRTVREYGGDSIMTSSGHQSGSDRIAEVAEKLPVGSIIVNIQGDEPTISPNTIGLAVDAMLATADADIVTTCENIENSDDVLSADVVKVVTDSNGFALYFSRSPIPFPRDAVKSYGSLENALRSDAQLLNQFRKHTGLYVYRREYLLEFTKLEPSILEKTEMLEQLRALENGARILVVATDERSVGVDSPEDFARVKALMEAPQRERL